MSEAGNTRTGFFENSQIRQVIDNLRDHGKPVPDLADFCLFAFLTGMRKGEIASLRWQDVEDDLLVLRGENAKNGHARTIPLEGELAEIIERRQARRAVKVNGMVVLSDLIFHRRGKPIKEFRKSWATACKMAGVPGRLFHDLRRSAVRDLVRSGVSQAVAKSISGHRTDAMFARYNISDVTDQRKALARVQEYRLSAAKDNEQEQPVREVINKLNSRTKRRKL